MLGATTTPMNKSIIPTANHFLFIDSPKILMIPTASYYFIPLIKDILSIEIMLLENLLLLKLLILNGMYKIEINLDRKYKVR